MSQAESAFLDLRGLRCPEPVLSAKKCLDNGQLISLEALVDDKVNVQNLARLAKSLQCQFAFQPLEDHFRISITRGAIKGNSSALSHDILQDKSSELPSRPASSSGLVVFIGKDTFGEGDREFSKQLLNLFLQTLFQSGHRPQAILMANSGVQLLEPSGQCQPVLDQFRAEGCEVLACALCIDYYGLSESVPKESITNMYAICEFLVGADKVISP
jgi:selenium metabolism protein YedF